MKLVNCRMEEETDTSESVVECAELTLCGDEIECCEEEVETDILGEDCDSKSTVRNKCIPNDSTSHQTQPGYQESGHIEESSTQILEDQKPSGLIEESSTQILEDQKPILSAIATLQECDALQLITAKLEDCSSVNDGHIDLNAQQCDDVMRVITLPNVTVEQVVEGDQYEMLNLSLPSNKYNLRSTMAKDHTPSSPERETVFKIEVVNDDVSSPCDSPSHFTIDISRNVTIPAAKVDNVKERQRQPHLPPCRICGEKASGFHYGVNTCEACKGFFRRSIKRSTEYKCVESDNKCVIEPGKRSICPKCRYDKCVKVGMSKSAIKTGRYTHEKRSKDIREIKSLEWMENTFPNSKCVDEVKELANTLIKAQKEMYGSNYDYWTDDAAIRKLTQDYFRQHRAKTDIFGDLDRLPEDEFNRFYNSTGIDIDNRIELMSEIATTLESGISRYINFVKHIPGFSSLSLDDQAALVKAARFEFWFVGYQRFVCTELGVTTGILKQTHHKSELSKVVGTEFVEALFQHSEKIQSLHLTVEDIAVLRSFLVVSPDRCTLQDREAVEGIQWKMMACLKHMCDINHGNDSHFLSKVIDKITSLRELTEMNEKRAQSIKLEWPILKNHPLLVELMSG